MSESFSTSNSEKQTMDNGEYLYASSPSEDISLRMRVPKRIKANGEAVEDDIHGPNGITSWDYREKFDMNVPDRILLIGQDQHLGTRAPPREIQLENSILGNTTTISDVRVSTPPRTITLEQHAFPSAAEIPTTLTPSDTPPSPSAMNKMMMMATPKSRMMNVNDSRILFRDTTPPIEGLSATEEIVHLRRQVARISRRITALESDAAQRQQMERLACAFGVAYVLIKIIFWLNRS